MAGRGTGWPKFSKSGGEGLHISPLTRNQFSHSGQVSDRAVNL